MSAARRGIYVVMGVSGSGKTTIGADLAHALDVDFVEGDEYHPAENVRRMAAGIPLTDEDRATWLHALATRLRQASTNEVSLVMTCSALKRAYRDILRGGASNLQLIFLRGSKALIAQRLASRRGHFMPPSLLASQFATLEEPGPDERAWVVDVRQPKSDVIEALVTRAESAKQ